MIKTTKKLVTPGTSWTDKSSFVGDFHWGKTAMRHSLIDLLWHSSELMPLWFKKMSRGLVCLWKLVLTWILAKCYSTSKPFCGPIHMQFGVANLFKKGHTLAYLKDWCLPFFFSHTVTNKRCESLIWFWGATFSPLNVDSIMVPWESRSHKGDSIFGCETPTKQMLGCPQKAEVTKESGGGLRSFYVSLLLDESEQIKAEIKTQISASFLSRHMIIRDEMVLLEFWCDVWNTMTHTIILKFQSLEVNNYHSKTPLWIHIMFNNK